MNNDTLLTTPLSKDANQIIEAINQRSAEIQLMLRNLSIPKRISRTIAKILTVSACFAALASVPTAVYQFSLKPLAYGAAALVVAAASAIAFIFLDNRSPTEAIIKKLWKQLFASISNGDATSVIATCESLVKKKAENKKAFLNALGKAPSDIAEQFIQKSLFSAHLLNALAELDNERAEEAKSCAHLALSSFVLSGLPNAAADCALAVVNKPGRVTLRLNQSGCPKSITDLDSFISIMSGLLDDEHLHDFVRL